MKPLIRYLLAIALCLPLGQSAKSQAVPALSTSIYLMDSVAGEPLSGCEIRVTVQLPDGSILYENPTTLHDDVHQTRPYPVGSVLAIDLDKRDFGRKTLQHSVNPNPLLNRIDVWMVRRTATNSPQEYMIEGDVFFEENGIRLPAIGEFVRIYTARGVKNIPINENGYYQVRLTPEEIAGKDTLRIRAAYTDDKFHLQDTFVATCTNYPRVNFLLQRKFLERTFEFQVRDAVTAQPLPGCQVRVYHGQLLLNEGVTDMHGYLASTNRYYSPNDSVRVVIVKEGYPQVVLHRSIDSTIIDIDLATSRVTLQGFVGFKGTKRPTVGILLDGMQVQSVQVDEHGNWQISLTRQQLKSKSKVTAMVEGDESKDEETISTADILRENNYSFPQLDPKSKAGTWKNQINIGGNLGINTDFALPPNSLVLPFNKAIRPVYRGGDFMMGFKGLPNLLLGLGYHNQLLYRKDNMDIPGTEEHPVFVVSDTFALYGIGINAKYYIGPRGLAGLRFVTLAEWSPIQQRDRALKEHIRPLSYAKFGGGLALGKKLRLEVTYQVIAARPQYVWNHRLNHFGNETTTKVHNQWITQPIFYLSLIKRWSW